MNILFICDEYPPGRNGGIGSITQSLCKAMSKQGHNICVVGLYHESYGEKNYEEDGRIRIWRLRYQKNKPHVEWSYKIQRNLPSFIQQKMVAYQGIRKFYSFIKELIISEKIDIIEIADWNTYAYDIGLNSLNLPERNVPLIVKLHGSKSYFSKEMGEDIRKKWFNLDRKIINSADGLIAVSEYTKHVYQQLFKPKKYIQVLYNGIELQEQWHNGTKRRNNLVVFAGTLIKKKGIFSLLKAWNFISRDHPGTFLHVYGKGNTTPLKNILELEVADTVKFHGHVNKQDLMKVYTQATLAIFPSYSETFGLAPIEAMSMGCPTIFTKNASGKEIIRSGINGLLVDPNDINDIRSKVNLLLKDNALRNQLGNTGQQDVYVRFNIDQCAIEHLKFYQEVIHEFYAR